MASVTHSLLSDPDLHEPKGVATASAGNVYVANGSGSGSWKAAGGSIYGELYIGNGSTSQTLNAVADTYNILNPSGTWQANGTNGTTLTPANGTITTPTAGVYFVSFWATFTTAAIASGAKYKFKYAVNGTVDTSRLLLVQKISNGADVLTCSATGIVSLGANDVLSVYVTGDATSANTAITVNDAGFTAVLLKV